MQTSARPASGLGLLDSYTPLGGNQTRLYYALREAVPIIDAAIFKTVRLTGQNGVRYTVPQYLDPAAMEETVTVRFRVGKPYRDADLAVYLDGRLLRRIVRDARTRGTSAQETIAMWPSVRRGEDQYIFPFQEEADVMFNSALIYELAV